MSVKGILIEILFTLLLISALVTTGCALVVFVFAEYPLEVISRELQSLFFFLGPLLFFFLGWLSLKMWRRLQTREMLSGTPLLHRRLLLAFTGFGLCYLTFVFAGLLYLTLDPPRRETSPELTELQVAQRIADYALESSVECRNFFHIKYTDLWGRADLTDKESWIYSMSDPDWNRSNLILLNLDWGFWYKPGVDGWFLGMFHPSWDQWDVAVEGYFPLRESGDEFFAKSDDVVFIRLEFQVSDKEQRVVHRTDSNKGLSCP